MRKEGDPFAPSTAKNVGKVVLPVFIPEERRKNASYEFQISYMQLFFSIVWNLYYSFFFLLFLTVGFVFCNVCALA